MQRKDVSRPAALFHSDVRQEYPHWDSYFSAAFDAKQPHVLPRNVGGGTIPYLAYSPRPHWRDVQPGIGGYVKQGLSQLNFEI